jgi:ABC-2 type transport system permease protein
LLFVLNIVCQTFNTGIDLTEDRRYTVSEQSKQVLENLDDIVFIRIYLDGDMPVNFKKFRTSVREKIGELKRYSRKNIQYEFRNPSEGDDENRIAVYRELEKKGIAHISVAERDAEGGSTQRLIFPGALVNYKGKELSVNFIHSNPMLTTEENLNLALQNLEYEIIHVIQKITEKSKNKIAFVEGHGELDNYSLNGILVNLKDFYDMDRVNIDGETGSLDEYKVVVIAKPLERWSEADKFVLDQYIMNGGRTAWFIDAVHVYEDSLSSGALTMGFVCEHNLNDQLFNYGVRINHNVIQDLQCSQIQVHAQTSMSNSMQTSSTKFRLVPWTYFPLLWTSFDNPITKGVNLVKAQYPGVIDTVGSSTAVKKQYLLYSSDKSKVSAAPLFVSLNQVDEKITEKNFNKSYLPVAVLLEGEFVSTFRNRMISQYVHDPDFKFRAKSENTKMIVVSDGDIIRNDVRRTSTPLPLPLGYDRHTDYTYGNGEFVTNIINYLADEKNLMSIKNRTVKMRLLDSSKIARYHTEIVLANTALPVIFVVVCGIVFVWLRRRKYSRPNFRD